LVSINLFSFLHLSNLAHLILQDWFRKQER
jgi:hypothetical protein